MNIPDFNKKYLNHIQLLYSLERLNILHIFKGYKIKKDWPGDYYFDVEYNNIVNSGDFEIKIILKDKNYQNKKNYFFSDSDDIIEIFDYYPYIIYLFKKIKQK